MRRLFFCCKDYNRLSSFLVASWILSTRCNGNVGNLHCTSEKNEFLNKNVTVGERTPNNRIVFSTSAAEMLKASQEALVQQASRDLISIQRKELQHFEKILGEFGLQGALFAGFISQVLCNVDALNNDPGPWKYIFWISLTIVSSLSLGITFSTTLAGIYAPGLALRGPPG